MPSTRTDDPLIHAAASWHARLRADDADAGCRQQFERWMVADLQHRLAYADVCAAAFAVDALANDMTTRVVQRVRRVTRLPRPRAWFLGMAAVLLLAVLASPLQRGWLLLRADHVSASAELRRIALEDGTRVLLGADSAIDVRFDGQRRQIMLLQGQADFDVATDPARPFDVIAGGVRATALGTRYAVRRDPGGVLVDVEHGRVEVAGDETVAMLGAGERIRVGHTGMTRVALSPAGASNWREGLLVFTDEPLQAVLATLDRHVDGQLWWLARRHADDAVTAAVPVTDAPRAIVLIAERHGLRVRSIPGVGTVVY